MPEVEIDIDDLLDADSEEERALKLRVSSFQNLELACCECLNRLASPNLVCTDPAPAPGVSTRTRAGSGPRGDGVGGCSISVPLHGISDGKAVLDYGQFSNRLPAMSFCSHIFLEEELVLASRNPFARTGSDVPQLCERRGAGPDLGRPSQDSGLPVLDSITHEISF